MGISGLIPFLEKSSSKVYLSDLRGSTVAVDTYCWLHKGVFTCAEKLVRGEETDLYIQYCLKYVNMLLSYDIKPILVFDGRSLPAKAITEKRRRESRQQSKKRAAELLRLGQVEEARSHMRRCIDVTHAMALRLIRACRQRNVDCIVAPYEADAQLAWLNKVNLSQYVITEDSDLLLFGARNVIFKLDLTGAGLLIESDKLYLAMGCHKERFTFDKFRCMCILSGCDYLDSLPGIGLAKACKFMLKTEEENMWRALRKIPQYLNMKNLEVDEEYIENFLKAEATFKHMYIYNPLKRKMERLYDLEEFGTEERFCTNAGTLLEDDEQAFQLALGNLNPFTLEKLDNWHPDKDLKYLQANPGNKNFAKHKSIWLASISDIQNRSLNNVKSTRTSDFCALQFKKVDFVGQTLIEDITRSIKEEEEKPAEADIYSMYSNQKPDGRAESDPKQGRESSSSPTDNASLSQSTPPKTITVPSKRNPFVKSHSDLKLRTSAAICKRNSFIKALNAEKNCCRDETVHNTQHTSAQKNSVFDEKQIIQVKSRFFPANVKEVLELQHKEAEDRDLSNEIDNIENLSQQMQDNRQLLYSHTSPPTSPNKKSIVEELKEFTFNNKTFNKEKYKKDAVSCNDFAQKSEEVMSLNADTIENGGECFVISDDDFDLTSVTETKISQLVKFKPQAGPRLGLAKPKTVARNKTKFNNECLPQSQPRLSMFGFQKRPKLK